MHKLAKISCGSRNLAFPSDRRSLARFPHESPRSPRKGIYIYIFSTVSLSLAGGHRGWSLVPWSLAVGGWSRRSRWVFQPKHAEPFIYVSRPRIVFEPCKRGQRGRPSGGARGAVWKFFRQFICHFFNFPEMFQAIFSNFFRQFLSISIFASIFRSAGGVRRFSVNLRKVGNVSSASMGSSTGNST